MALNSLGELETAPGAAERETAHVLNLHKRSLKNLANAQWQKGRLLCHKQTAHRVAMGADYYLDDMDGASKHLQQAREACVEARELFNDAVENRMKATQLGQEALKNRVKGALKTFGAKLGFCS